MTLFEIRKIAETVGLVPDQPTTKLKLIREIQLSEGTQPCFATGSHQKCDMHNCRWREDCQIRDALMLVGSHKIKSANGGYDLTNACVDKQIMKTKKIMGVQIK